MKTTKTLLLTAASAILVMAPAAHATLVVNSDQTANDLVNALLSGSSGITVSSAHISGDSSGLQNGIFSGGNSANLGFDGGIVLSSGDVSALPLDSSGSNDGADTTFGDGGDAKLDALVSGGTHDASVLSFDFVPTGNQITFQYVFGSTEYNYYVNSQYNDVFAFFVNDVNEALVPNTNIPVAIDNVNCGQNNGPATSGSPGSGAVSNCGYFVNNRNNDGTASDVNDATVGANALVNLGGLTSVLTLVADVNPNVTNTMYIAIADTSDDQLDSAVFLEGGTLSVCGGPGQPPCNPPSVPEPGTMPLLGIGALSLLLARRRKSPQPR